MADEIDFGGKKLKNTGNVALGNGSTTASNYSAQTISGGLSNTTGGPHATVGGGLFNQANGDSSVVGGGNSNNAAGAHSTISGGQNNYTSPTAMRAVVGGGQYNNASGGHSTVSGGKTNTASGDYSSILGGLSNNTNSYANAHIIGSNITADAADTAYVNNLKFAGNGAATGGTLTNAIFKTYREVTNAPTIASNALTLDLSLAQVFNVALTDNITTLTISNTPADANTATGFTLIFTADGTARSVTWPASITWYSGSAPSLPTTNGAKAILTFLTTDNGTTWDGF